MDGGARQSQKTTAWRTGRRVASRRRRRACMADVHTEFHSPSRSLRRQTEAACTGGNLLGDLQDDTAAGGPSTCWMATRTMAGRRSARGGGGAEREEADCRILVGGGDYRSSFREGGATTTCFASSSYFFLLCSIIKKQADDRQPMIVSHHVGSIYIYIYI